MAVWDIFDAISGMLESIGRPLGALVNTTAFKIVIGLGVVVAIALVLIEAFKRGLVTGLIWMVVLIPVTIGLFKLGAWGYEWMQSKG